MLPPVPNDPAARSTCPGCGASLPASDWPVDRRRNVSAACWEQYTAVLAHEAEQMPVLGHLHQLTVDTYAAQHLGPQVPAISVPFALIGMLLALEESWSGVAVRAAHGYLAEQQLEWPSFSAPEQRGAVTAADVAAARTPEQHAALVDRWAAVTWDAWSEEHGHIRAWAAEVLPPAARARLRAETGSGRGPSTRRAGLQEQEVIDRQHRQGLAHSRRHQVP